MTVGRHASPLVNSIRLSFSFFFLTCLTSISPREQNIRLIKATAFFQNFSQKKTYLRKRDSVPSFLVILMRLFQYILNYICHRLLNFLRKYLKILFKQGMPVKKFFNKLHAACAIFVGKLESGFSSLEIFMMILYVLHKTIFHYLMCART